MYIIAQKQIKIQLPQSFAVRFQIEQAKTCHIGFACKKLDFDSSKKADRRSQHEAKEGRQNKLGLSLRGLFIFATRT